MAVLRVAHVWGDRLLDVRHLAGSGAVGPLTLKDDRIRIGAKELSVEAGKQVDVPFGATTLQLTWVGPEQRPTAAAKDTDWNFAKLVGCLLLLSAALVAMFTIEVQLGLTEDDSALSRFSPRVLKFEVPAPPPKPSRLDPSAVVKADAQRVPSPSNPRRADKPLQAKNAGLLGALDALKDAQALFAPGVSPGVQNALDNLQNGPPIADAQGLGGMGPRGVGPGSPNGLSIGGPGFSRRPSGGPTGALTRKIDTGPCCEATKVSDGLSKDVIAKVIRRHFAEIKFCYEQSLQQKPDLAGKLVILFVIDAAGAVSEADVAEATLEDPNVEACLLSRVRRWKFPEPRGGGVVSVTHPWFFKPAGSED